MKTILLDATGVMLPDPPAGHVWVAYVREWSARAEQPYDIRYDGRVEFRLAPISDVL